jgi:immunoglobulin-binding protein 1
LQKEVYGLGYPSLPVLSVDEFYEQRVREGWWKPPGSSSGTAASLQVRNLLRGKKQHID